MNIAISFLTIVENLVTEERKIVMFPLKIVMFPLKITTDMVSLMGSTLGRALTV